MNEYFKDWLNWFNWISIIIIISEFITYHNTFVRWKWGYYSIDLIPAFILLITVTVVSHYVIQERRWKEFKKLRKDYTQLNYGGIKHGRTNQ